MIAFEKVSKKFKQKNVEIRALNEVTLTIDTQEVFGVVGESGSGKSTFLRLINHLESPDSGEVFVDGVNFSLLNTKEQRKKRQKMGMIFQQFNLLGNKTVKENVDLPLKLQRRNEPDKIEQMLQFVKMAEKADQYPSSLSGGEKQRVAIARALAMGPEILLCDEPTSALDDQHTYEMIQLLAEIHHTFAATIIIVSHELEVIKALCNRTAILEKGKLLAVTSIKNDENFTHYENYYERVKEILG